MAVIWSRSSSCSATPRSRLPNAISAPSRRSRSRSAIASACRRQMALDSAPSVHSKRDFAKALDGASLPFDHQCSKGGR
jgi:hypothetical protein